MRKLLLFAAVAGLGLVSASPPGKGPETGAREAPHHYPPCSRTVRDRCIQLYERGVRAPARAGHHARMEDHPDNGRRGHGEHGAGRQRGAREHHARAEHHGGPDHHARGDHRNCPDHHARADRREHVAVEHRTVRRAVRIAQVQRASGCRCAQPRRHYAQRVRRAGERG
jgi:hypothetical protein